MSGALIKRNPSEETPATRPMFVAEVVRRPLPVERPVPSPPSSLRTTTLIPPPFPSGDPSELVSGEPALQEETLRISALKVPRVTPRKVIAIGCAMVMSLGAGVLIRVLSRPANHPPPKVMAAPEREITAAAPAAHSLPRTAVDVARRTKVSLLNTQVLRGNVPQTELSQAMIRSLATMQLCLEQHPHETKALSGDAVLRLRLGRSGRVRWVRATPLTAADGCIADSLRDTRFPKNETGLLAEVTLRLSE